MANLLLTGLESAALPMLNWKHIYLFGKIQTSQIGGQLDSDTTPYKLSECSLVNFTCKPSSEEVFRIKFQWNPGLFST